MKSLREEASDNIAKRLGWQTGVKDQAGIASDLAIGKDIQEIYGLGEAGLFDEFFYFLRAIDVMPLLEALAPKGLRKRASNIKFPAVILVYLMRIISGLRFFWHVEPVLLQSQALMHLVGFNGREILEGSTRRGLPKAAAVPEGKKSEPEKKPAEVRGPMGADSVADYIQAIAAKTLEKFFNRVVGVLAANSFFPKRVHALLDASAIESTEKCVGCGMVKKEKAPELRLRRGRIRKVVEKVFGFKIWVVWDPNSKLPLAMRFATINVADCAMTKEVVEQAIANLGDHARIVSLALDRGFLDGALLWWLHTTGITFYMPAKSNLDVYRDALSLTDAGVRQTREKTRAVGRGKDRKTVTDRWDVAGIEGLTSAGFYGERGSGSHEHNRDFVPNPINAVVVLHDPYRENNPNAKTLVILTNGPVQKPLVVYDAYDARSEIENSLFREAKQAWFIERPAKNTAQAFRAHCYLTLITMALTTAFLAWMIAQEKREHRGEETGIRIFRQEVRVENCNKLIVFDQDRYAIFEAYELVILLGKKVRMPRGVPETITREDILRKYGALRE